MTTLRVLFHDQLSYEMSSLKGCDKKRDLILLAELEDELTNVAHHQKKIVFALSALRHFALDLQKNGYQVLHFKLDDPKNCKGATELVERICKERKIDKIVVTRPGEYRVWDKARQWGKGKIPCEVCEDTRYFSDPEEFNEWAGDKKSLRMETFYRQMRKKHGFLMEGNEPTEGEWNFDTENRKPPDSGKAIPPRLTFSPDETTKEVIRLVQARFGNHFGSIHPFELAVTREDALKVLEEFIKQRLELFGPFQDAMLQDEPYLYHSVISYYLNNGLLVAREVCAAAEQAYLKKRAPINSVEGFIRQILGWREFLRGIYWLKMPAYVKQNYLGAKRSLPSFYWDGKTDMNCLHQVVEQTRSNAYSHHIQRLMVTGNFALLAGILPEQVCEWYLIVYADAYEWVELPNTLGMSLFGDGGLFASKPYIASGKYINRMSNYCKSCRYDPNQTTGDKACPFNSLYWDFLARHQEKLAPNMRLKFAYSTLRRMKEDKREATLKQAQDFLKKLSSSH